MDSTRPISPVGPPQEKLVTKTYQHRASTPLSEIERFSDLGDPSAFEISEADQVDRRLQLSVSSRQKRAINFFRGGRIVSAAVASAGISGLICAEMMGEKDDKAFTHGLLTGLGTFFYFVSSCSGLEAAGPNLWKTWRSNLADGIVPAVMVATVYFGQAHGVI